jgi:hypothetical protein
MSLKALRPPTLSESVRDFRVRGGGDADMPRFPLVVVLLAIPVDVSAQVVEQTSGPTVVLRFYKYSISAEEFGRARRLAGSVLGAGGVSVSWLQCWSDDLKRTPISAGCRHPIAPNELILHIVRATDANSASNRESLGFSMIDPQAGAGTVATVYSDRVAALAREVRIDGADLLGLAMAHELGHLLIGTDEHAARGLMRAVWTRTELQRNTAEDWMFSETEMKAIRRAARMRSIGPTLDAAAINGSWKPLEALLRRTRVSAEPSGFERRIEPSPSADHQPADVLR